MPDPESTMGMLLSDNDKLIILLIASVLIIMTLIITTCLVKPTCFLYYIFVKPKTKKKETFLDLGYPPSLVNPESQHFHLSIVPVYGSEEKSNETCHSSSLSSSATAAAAASTTSSALLPLRQIANSLNQYEHLTHLAEKARNRYSSLKNHRIQEIEGLPKIDALITYEQVNESAIRLHISIHQVLNLKMKPYLMEPSCYITVVLVGNKTRRKSIINKVTQSELYRSETIKQSLNPTFINAKFISEELPRCLLKEGSIKLRVMDDDRYANDTCIGEVTIPLKHIKPFNDINKNDNQLTKKRDMNDLTSDDEGGMDGEDNNREPCEWNENNNSMPNLYVLFPMKEIKGELLVGFCFLPTSKRINVTIVKGTLRHLALLSNSSATVHQTFFVRVLMFNNGKLIKKKKTSLSIRLLWDENETLTFELPDDVNSVVTFMTILSFKLQNSASPISPESPQASEAVEEEKDANNNNNNNNTSNEPSQSRKNSTNSSRKDRCIGHFFLDSDSCFEEIIKYPRKQILKWYKLN